VKACRTAFLLFVASYVTVGVLAAVLLLGLRWAVIGDPVTFFLRTVVLWPVALYLAGRWFE
jgi:hypothetical protein